jgi:hypothetical protein
MNRNELIVDNDALIVIVANEIIEENQFAGGIPASSKHECQTATQQKRRQNEMSHSGSQENKTSTKISVIIRQKNNATKHCVLLNLPTVRTSALTSQNFRSTEI